MPSAAVAGQSKWAPRTGRASIVRSQSGAGKSYLMECVAEQIVTTHSFRHACATEMLKGGASVRHVQEMLGHADISTTQIYTHLAKADLKKIHGKTAPSERRKDKHAPQFELTGGLANARSPEREADFYPSAVYP